MCLQGKTLDPCIIESVDSISRDGLDVTYE